MPLLTSFARGIFGLLSPETVAFEGQILPARRLRFGGVHFQSDAAFLHSGQAEAKRLQEWCGLSAQSRILDIGCGTGRLPVGILATVGAIAGYTGVDVSEAAIRWCRRHIETRHPSFRFLLTDVKNDRYNPKGEEMGETFSLPLPSSSFDIISLYSVFSHMEERDVRIYLREFRRLLRPEGKVFLTAFVEENVPPVSVNPPDYRMEWKGALHCVRFDKRHFQTLAAGEGFSIVRFDYATETDGQSALLLSLLP